jgi:hypothetical protein
MVICSRFLDYLFDFGIIDKDIHVLELHVVLGGSLKELPELVRVGRAQAS